MNDSILTKEKLEHALQDALAKIEDSMIPDFSDAFPTSASKDGVYGSTGNVSDWTQSFWTGILWLAYELSKKEVFSDTANHLMESFEYRLKNRLGLDSHDIGFIYLLSTVAGYKVTGNPALKDASLEAAQLLADRFREKGQFIQLVGDENVEDPQYYRLIIDCLMNIELLYWAGKESGNKDLTRKAFAHFTTTMETVVRPDGSTFQNFYFDPKTGARLRGGSKQGFSADSCWSRGHSWGVIGIPLTYSYMKNDDILDTYYAVTDYYLDHLPKDHVAYWDLCFTEGDEPRDSSAAAIAVCGLLEACKEMPLDDAHRARYQKAAEEIMNSLIENYTTKDDPKSNGLLKHATYYYAGNNGVDECNIWGDYFYMEALMRFLNPDWKQYW